MTEAE